MLHQSPASQNHHGVPQSDHAGGHAHRTLVSRHAVLGHSPEVYWALQALASCQYAAADLHHLGNRLQAAGVVADLHSLGDFLQAADAVVVLCNLGVPLSAAGVAVEFYVSVDPLQAADAAVDLHSPGADPCEDNAGSDLVKPGASSSAAELEACVLSAASQSHIAE